MKKIILKKQSLNNYFFVDSSSVFMPSDFIVFFLTDSYNGVQLRRWLVNESWKFLEKNMISLEKMGSLIIFSNNYNENENKPEFAVSRITFLKILNEWEQARSESKEYIVIEVSDNNDVHVYATDSIEPAIT